MLHVVIPREGCYNRLTYIRNTVSSYPWAIVVIYTKQIISSCRCVANLYCREELKMEEKCDRSQTFSVKTPDANVRFLSYTTGHEIHEHQFYELEITLLGEGTQTINGTTHPMRRGEVHIIRPGDTHSFRTDGSLKTFMVRFSPRCVSSDIIAELGQNDRALITYLNNDECDAFENLCKTLDILKSAECDIDSEVMYKLINVLLSFFCSSLNNRKRAREARGDSTDKIAQILDWMHMHYRTHISADDIAKQFHFNTAYLRRLFKERVGVSIMHYLKELRLEYAKNLLLTTSLKISEVCDRSGYGSMPTFISDFKQKYHQAPLSFREKYANESGRES